MKGDFAFLIHPIEFADITRKFKFFSKLPPSVVSKLTKHIPPVKVSRITGITTEYGEAQGWFVGLPLFSEQILGLPEPFVIKRIIQAGRLAASLGAKIIGLGALTSVVGDGGITVAKNLPIAVTTGNSYTVATAVEGTREACRMMGKDMTKAHAVVVGGTGSIGRVCALLLGREVRSLTLVGRDQKRLEEVAQEVIRYTGVSVDVDGNVSRALQQADVVLTVTSAVDTVIKASDLKRGAVVCDVARPRDVSKEVAALRKDVLVIEGGVVEIPGDVQFNFNFGFPPKLAYACMAETIILALEGRYENFSLGRELSLERVEEISTLAKKHGFKLAGFRSFERVVSSEFIDEVRHHAFGFENKVRVEM